MSRTTLKPTPRRPVGRQLATPPRLAPLRVAPARVEPDAKAALAEQKSDFTAEGAPPPGKVANSIPVSGNDAPRTRRRRAPAAGP